MNCKLVLSLLLVLFLSACDGGYTSAPAVDLYEAEAMVKRAKAQTEEAAQVTRQAVAQETRQAARTREASIYEMQLIDKQIEGTAVAYSVGATIAVGTAQVESARATQAAAAIGTATAWPQTAVPLQATQAAIAASAQYADARANMSVVGDLVKFIAALAIMAWTIVKVVTAFTNRFQAAESTQGVVTFAPNVRVLPPNGEPPVDVRFRDVPRIPHVTALNRSGTVLSSPPIDDDERMRRELIDMVKKAINVVGEDADQLPRWDAIGMNSEKMQKLVRAGEQRGLFKALPRLGTFTVGGRSLKVILWELRTEGKIPHLERIDQYEKNHA